MFEPGQRIAQFQLLDKLGQGGMGVVYRALDTRLGRPVALKVMPAEFAHDAERRARFLSEARTAAQVTHPNIATIYQVDEAEGQIFIAMELVEGQSLDAWLRGRSLTVEQALGIGRDLSAGVGRAHARGIVHRDLKPQNVMISSTGQLKILDFGIAKTIERVAPGPRASGTQPMAAVQTREGHVLGTAGYMSPEQAMGAPVDARSDVFSLGVILYELLTGQRAFRGETYAALVLSTTRDEPPPASALNPRIGAPVERLLAACLAKDPARRLPSAQAVTETIEQLLGSGLATSGVTVPAAVPVATQRLNPAAPSTQAALAGTVPRRSKAASWVLLLGLLATVAFAALAVLALLVWQLTDWFTPTLRPPEAGLGALARYEDPADSRTSTLSAPVWATAQRDFETAARQRGAPKRWDAAADFARGQRLFSLGRLDEAEQAFEQSLKKDDSFALPWLGLSSTYLRKKRLDEAIEAAEKAQVLAPRLWPAISAGARAYAHKSQMDFAIQEYRRAVAMAPGKPYLLSELALTYHAAGMDSEAERYANEALKLDGEVVPALVLLAERALEDRDGAEALNFAKRATAVEPRDVSAWLARGDAELLSDAPEAAKDAWQTALKLWHETRQRGAPAQRLREVQVALDQGKIPEPRGGARGSTDEDARAAEAAGRTSDARSVPRSQPVARSKPAARSKPVARSKPAPRSRPAAEPAPAPRSVPNEGPVNF